MDNDVYSVLSWARGIPKGKNGWKLYRFSFTADGTRHFWLRYGTDMDKTLYYAKIEAEREYQNPSAFCLESSQED